MQKLVELQSSTIKTGAGMWSTRSNSDTGQFEIVFDKLIDCQIPLDLFKEGYFKISKLKVRHVANQQLLVDLLRNGRITSLELEYDCNLRQSFVREIVDSRCVPRILSLDEHVWNRMNDFSVLSRLIIDCFTVTFQQLRCKAAAHAVLRNPHCVSFHFENYKGFYYSDEMEEGKHRNDLNFDSNCSHQIQRAGVHMPTMRMDQLQRPKPLRGPGRGYSSAHWEQVYTKYD